MNTQNSRNYVFVLGLCISIRRSLHSEAA